MSQAGLGVPVEDDTALVAKETGDTQPVDCPCGHGQGHTARPSKLNRVVVFSKCRQRIDPRSRVHAQSRVETAANRVDCHPPRSK